MDLLTFNLDTESNVFLYEQLYVFIKSEIQSGNIASKTKLPSKRKLSAYLEVSQNTVQTAYDQLIEEGYILSVERKGYYVNEIDNLIQIENMTKEKLLTSSKKNEKSQILYDLSYEGVDLEHFPFKTWRKLYTDLINKNNKNILQSGSSQGNILLRESIAEYLYQFRGVKSGAEQIIISSGTEFLYQILFQLFDKKVIYGVENPGYEILKLLFANNQINFEGVALDQKGMLPQAVVKSKAKILCVTPAHQFPTGEIMPIDRRVQLVNWANEEAGRYIIEDDYDSEFKYSGKPIPALQGLDSNAKVIYMGTFSKSLSPAIRVSYMVLPHHLLKTYQKKLSYHTCPVPVLDQKVLLKFIQEGFFAKHLNKMRNIYKRKRELLVHNLERMEIKNKIQGADTGLHLILKVDNGMTEEELVSSALQKKVKIYGMTKYYLDKTYQQKSPEILIGFASIKESDISMAISLLNEAWKKF